MMSEKKHHEDCPFCGSQIDELAVRESIDGNRVAYGVMCSGCGAWGPLSIGKESAWGYWDNRPHILAAAPEMLEALEMVLRVIDLGNASGDSAEAFSEWSQAHETMTQAVHAAIQKARGEE